MSILVTGATGFIGQHLVASLSNLNLQINVLARPGSDVSNFSNIQNIKIVFGDINEPACINQINGNIDFLFHLAADWSKLDVQTDVKFITGLLNKGLKKIIFFSSVCAYGLDYINNTLVENHQPKFLDSDFYGRYKYQVEEYLLQLNKGKIIDAVILRPTLVYGPGDASAVFSLIKAVRMQNLALWDKGKRMASPCHVQNLTKIAIGFYLNQDWPSGIYNVADKEQVTTYQLTTEISKSMGLIHQFQSISSKFGYYKGFLNFILNRFELSSSMATHFAFNIWKRSYDVRLEKLRGLIGEDFLMSFEAGVMDTINWCRLNNKI